VNVTASAGTTHVPAGLPDSGTAEQDGGVPAGAATAQRTILVDGVPVRFSGYEVPGLVVLCANFTDHVVAVLARNWPLGDQRLVRVADLAIYS
jgi:hypothetical protein